tara:strand:+ start:5373 stop:6446 length:1074 start_codon:yes stop_codon:yes gene_type:complete
MPTVLQFRRGTTGQNDLFTGANGEISVDTDKKTMRIHDGSTAGGSELLTSSLTATLTNKTLTSPNITTSILPTSADGATIGSASKEFSDLFLADGSTIQFGNDQDITVTHVADQGLNLKATSTSGNSGAGMHITMQTGDTTIATNDTLGAIKFQAPDDSAGTDAILVAAQIKAQAEGNFSSSSNATRIAFYTGASETATEKFQMRSNGDLRLITDSAKVQFGADQDVHIQHDPDDGLILKSTATADDNPVLLTLQTGETDIQASDIIGSIRWQAPDEGTGTDANLVCAAIDAVSAGDFSVSNNTTNMSFKLGVSETATEKMRLESDGELFLTPTSILLIKNSSGTTLKTINGVGNIS